MERDQLKNGKRAPAKRPFINVGYLGLLVAGMSIVLLAVFPSRAAWMMKGFYTPILAFEFVQSPDEVERMFGFPGTREHSTMLASMDLGNRLDYLYMLLYTSFLFFFSRACARTTGRRHYYAGSGLSIVILMADALENVQLLKITAKMAGSDIAGALVFLHVFTWIKWGGIAVVFLILALYFFRGGSSSKTIAVLGVVSFLLSVGAYCRRSVLNELMGLSVSLMFLAMIVYCFIYKHRKRRF